MQWKVQWAFKWPRLLANVGGVGGSFAACSSSFNRSVLMSAVVEHALSHNNLLSPVLASSLSKRPQKTRHDLSLNLFKRALFFQKRQLE